MAKIIKAEELSKIIEKLLSSDVIDDAGDFSVFMADLAEVVTNHCGGEVLSGAVNLDDDLGWTVSIAANDSLPSDGGIWKDYDTDVSFIDGEEVSTATLVS